MQTKSTMRRGCAVTATISMEETKSLGTVRPTNYMPTVCAKIAISIATIEKEERRRLMKKIKKSIHRANLKKNSTLD